MGLRAGLVLAIGAVLGVITASSARAATLQVGTGKPFAKPCAAIVAAADGDTIEIDAAGSYAGDVCAINRNNLTLRGVGNGRAHIDAAGMNYGGKGIWVIAGSNTTVENIELSGAKVPDLNGAGIRQEGPGLVVRNCFFHDNENGILTGAGPGEVLIEGSEFARNGAGDGYSHNMYIGNVRKFTLRWSYSHHSKIGHIVKSRAQENHILYNRLMDEADGTSSYTVDLPNGGTSFLIGNLIQQGPSTDNSGMVAYAAEGATNPGSDLYVVNNTFVNDRGSGAFLQIAGGAMPVIVRNNIFFGGGTAINQATAVMANNFSTGDPLLLDRAGFDYRLKAGSPCLDAGGAPGMGGGISLLPQFQYLHPAQREARLAVGTIDIGAYELGGGTPADAGSASDGAGGGSGSGGGSGGASATGGNGGTTVSGSGGSGSGGSASGDAGQPGAASSSGGCSCTLSTRGSSGSAGLLASIALALAAIATGRTPNRPAARRHRRARPR